MSGRRRRQSNIDAEIEPCGNSTRIFESESHIRVSFSDFESIFREFSGDESLSIKTWILDFERYANTFKWNELEKLIFCKRLLRGSAKLYVECEVKPTTYHELKNALYKEFALKVNSADIHRKLRERKKKSDESYREYLYKVIGIASQAEIDEMSIISYIISGINDSGQNKSVLYSAKTIDELKEKLIIYEKIKNDTFRQNAGKIPETNKLKTVVKNEKMFSIKYCFSCGARDHEIRSCPQKEKGPKCFNCNNFGHKRPDCPELVKNALSSHVITRNDMQLKIKVNDKLLTSLVDTGSEICAIKEDYLPLIKPRYFSKYNRISISGLGATVTTKGCCKVRIQINNVIFNDVEVHVVDSKYMKPDFILGMSLLKYADVTINSGEVTIAKTKIRDIPVGMVKVEEETSMCFLAEIKANDEDDEMDSNFQLEDDDDDKDAEEEVEDDGDNDNDDDDDEDDEDDEEEEKYSDDDEEVQESKPKKLKLSNAKQNGDVSAKEETKSDKNKNKQKQKQQQQQQQQQQKLQQKTLQAGVKIEDIHVNNGPEVKPGKKCSIYYKGRLKQNNKVFDSTKKGRGLKFAVEKGEVIKGMKIRPKLFGPYRVVTIKGFDRYRVQKEGDHEGPSETTCSADKMKYWNEDNDLDDFEPYDDDDDDGCDNNNDEEIDREDEDNERNALHEDVQLDDDVES